MKKYINNQEYLKEIGERIKLYRVSQGITQKMLEELSGVSQRSITRLEQGTSVQMESFIKILFALKLDENLLMLIPNVKDMPSYHFDEYRPKQRARQQVHKETGFVWGEDK